MTATASRLRTRVLPWLLTLVLLAAAWTIVKVTLPDSAMQEPFERTASIGEPATARNLVVTVTDVRAARRVQDAEGWSADGTWLVVDLEAASRVTQVGALLGIAELKIGDRVFSATERGTTFHRQALITGVPRSGSLAFEVPADALSGTATLQLGAPTAAGYGVSLDDLIVMPIDLDDVPVEASADLAENGWAR